MCIVEPEKYVEITQLVGHKKSSAKRPRGITARFAL
jgi:hypothetical protein